MKGLPLAAVILAAGQSTRMKSNTSKMLHQVCGRPVIRYVVDLVEAIGPERIVMVVGYQAERIQAELSGKDIKFVRQDQQLGTAHAILQTKDLMADFVGTILVLNGDVPLLTVEEVTKLIDLHHQEDAGSSILSSYIPDPFGYGRILRNEAGAVLGIIEEKEATEKEKKIKEINTGTYCFNSEFFYDQVAMVNDRNTKKEYYLTDVISILRQGEEKIQAILTPDFRITLGINTRAELAEANRIMRHRIIDALMREGVTVIDPNHTYIDFGVKVDQDTLIGPGCIIEGTSCIGKECYLGPFSRIMNSRLEDNVYLEGGCFIKDAYLTTGARILANILP